MSANVSARAKYLLNKMNSVAADAQLGTMLEAIDTAAGGAVAALDDGHIFVGDSNDEAQMVQMSGDVTLDNAGVATIGASKILKAMLATGILPSHVAKFAGTFTTAGGDASESIPVVGAVGTDIVMVSVKTAGGTPRSIVAAAAGTDAIAVTMSGDPSTDHVLQYVVLRATT